MKYIEPEKNQRKNYRSLAKHNHLIQGKYSLTGIEQKLLYKIFEEVQQNNYQSRRVEIVQDKFFKDYKGVVAKRLTNSQINKMLEDLQDKKVYLLNEDETYIRTQWYALESTKDLSRISIILDEYVFKYIQSLKGHFTMLRLETLYSFKSFHSMRIYELLKQSYNPKEKVSMFGFTVDTFKDLLGLDVREEKVNGKVKVVNKGYKNFNNLKVKVLDPSIDEINSKSEILVSYDVKRKGARGKVEGIIFKVFMKEQAKEVNVSETKEDDVSNSKEMENEGVEKFVPHFQFNPLVDGEDDVSNLKEMENEGVEIQEPNYEFTQDEKEDSYKEDEPLFFNFIPDILRATEDVKILFRNDYWNINFNDSDYKRFLLEAQYSILNKDQIEEIGIRSYAYFKKTLDEKIKAEKDKRITKRLEEEMSPIDLKDYTMTFSPRISLEQYVLMDGKEKYLKILEEKMTI